MTEHARTKIRSYFVEALTGLDSTGDRVHASRMFRPDDIANHLSVYLKTENVLHQFGSKGFKGVVQAEIHIQCFVASVENYDSNADLILREVQEALSMNRANLQSNTLSDQLLNYQYERLDEVEYLYGEELVTSQVIVYSVLYNQNL